jgi:hypothetical protein
MIRSVCLASLGGVLLLNGCGLAGLSEVDLGLRCGLDIGISRIFDDSPSNPLSTTLDEATVAADCAACDEQPVVVGGSLPMHAEVDRLSDAPVVVDADPGLTVELGAQDPCSDYWSRDFTVHFDEPGFFELRFMHGSLVIDSVQFEVADPAGLELQVKARQSEDAEWTAPPVLESLLVPAEGVGVRARVRDAQDRELDPLDTLEWEYADPEVAIFFWGVLLPAKVGQARLGVHVNDLSQVLVLRVDSVPPPADETDSTGQN